MFHTPPTHLTSHKTTALVALGTRWDNADKTHGAMSRIPCPGASTFTPSFLICIRTKQRYHKRRRRSLYSAGTRCFVGHDVIAGYSLKHPTHANGNTTWPCMPTLAASIHANTSSYSTSSMHPHANAASATVLSHGLHPRHRGRRMWLRRLRRRDWRLPASSPTAPDPP